MPLQISGGMNQYRGTENKLKFIDLLTLVEVSLVVNSGTPHIKKVIRRVRSGS